MKCINLKYKFFFGSLKCAKILPIYKKGDHNDVNNCRPIVIVPSFEKVLENAINIQLVQRIESNNRFNKNILVIE